jgi:hypothetical protein
MKTRMMAVCAAILLSSGLASADSRRARDRDGQLTEPSAADREKARKEWQARLDILKLTEAIRDIVEQQKGRTPPRIIELPDPSSNKAGPRS